jgi:hypothetical protein
MKLKRCIDVFSKGPFKVNYGHGKTAGTSTDSFRKFESVAGFGFHLNPEETGSGC